MSQRYYTFVIISISIFVLVISFFVKVVTEPKQLEVTFLDVGQGDAILITSVTGKQVLIDGGKYLDVDYKIARHMPFYDRSINMVLATHPDLDHVGGLVTVMRRYVVGMFIHSGLGATSEAYRELTDMVVESDIPIVTARAGQIIPIDEYTEIEILSPRPGMEVEDVNDHSIVAKLTYGDTSMILTGDASMHNEWELVEVYGEKLESDILKLGHHGSKTSSSSNFLREVNPEYAIVSAGCANTYGHPDPNVVDRVESMNITLLNTCDHGDITFTSNGKEWQYGS